MAQPSGNIRLHHKLGVNPRMSFCPRCGGPAEDVVLVGILNGVWQCDICSSAVYGVAEPFASATGGTAQASHHECPKCTKAAETAADGPVPRGMQPGVRRSLTDMERVPGSLCKPCDVEAKEHADAVALGGVYFRCADCGIKGVIGHDTMLAKTAREHAERPPPLPLGVEFTKADCIRCGPNPVVPAAVVADDQPVTLK